MALLDWIKKLLDRSDDGSGLRGEGMSPVNEPDVSAEEIEVPSGESDAPAGIPAFGGALLAVTCIGQSHIKHGTVCQDSSLCYEGENFRLIAVSDGHGSSSFPRSERGSRAACRAALEACKAFAPWGVPEDREQGARRLCSDILARWTEIVLADYAAEPFSEEVLEGVSEKYREHYRCGRHVEHAYGATLIAALELEGKVLAIRCGDGECITIDGQGRFATPIPWNEKCDVNVTTSLCDRDAIDEFRWVWLEEYPAAIWMGTDGVDNSYSVPEDLEEFYANLSVTAMDGGADRVREKLEQFLPMLTQRCSQDDLSVAGLWNTAGLTTAREALSTRLELRQAIRDCGEIQRRIKLTNRILEEKEKELAKTEPAACSAILREMDTFRQEAETLKQKLAEREARVRRLQGGGLPPAE